MLGGVEQVRPTQPDSESSVLSATWSSGVPCGGQGTASLSRDLGFQETCLKTVLQRKGEKGQASFPTFSTEK